MVLGQSQLGHKARALTPSFLMQFNNLGQRSLPSSVVFWIPVQLNKVTIWDHPQVVFSQVSPAVSPEVRSF